MKNYNKKELGYCRDGSVIYESYYIDGKLHRVDGPAYIYYEDGSVRYEGYWIDGKEYTNREWEAKTKTTTCEGKVVEIDGKKYKLTEIDEPPTPKPVPHNPVPTPSVRRGMRFHFWPFQRFNPKEGE